VPMRSVPHRVVCLLGLDDGVFPRQSIRDGDDVLARDPRVGERDPRSEDRQLLLDAISAAEERLIITYTGSDERTGAEVPPAVPLGELLDAFDRTATAPDGRRVRDVITVRHPLQPFDPRNFEPGAIRREVSFSFDPLGYEGARAAVRPRVPPTPMFGPPLPPKPPADVDLADLRQLLAHPARGFLRQRLGVAETRDEDEPEDALPVELSSLEQWSVGNRVLRERLAGLDMVDSLRRERHRGTLPPGPLGDSTLRDIWPKVEGLLQASAVERAQPPESLDVDIPLADGTRLAGTVSDVRGDTVLALTYSRLAARPRLLAWIDLVVLTVARPERTWNAVAFGRARGRNRVQRSIFGPLTPDVAAAALDELVALYRAGLQSPLPLPLKTAATYADRRLGADVTVARAGAAGEWEEGRFPGERDEPVHQLLYGRGAELTVLTDQVPLPDEAGPGWPVDETDRFGLLARRLWGRLLEAEQAMTL
jgi:exodeoxyribonuclease V gamma subunit